MFLVFTSWKDGLERQPHRYRLESGKREAEKPVRGLVFPASRLSGTVLSM